MSESAAMHAFEAAANDGVLLAPGVAGLEVLCNSFGLMLTEQVNMQDVCEELGVDPTAAVSKTDFENLINSLGWEEDDNENVGVDVMLEAIAAQHEKKERWEVRPEQISEARKKEEARDLCELCNEMKVEAAIIQSKHDARFEDFMSENPCGRNLPFVCTVQDIRGIAIIQTFEVHFKIGFGRLVLYREQ